MKLRKFLYLYLALWLTFSCIVIIVWMMDYSLLIGTTGTAFLIQSILNCVAVARGVVLAFQHYRETEKALKNKVILVVIAGGVALVLLCWNFLCVLLNGAEEYHSFTSPDNTHTIVIMENVSLISGQVVLYERVNPFLIYPKERIITDDGHRPICAGEYSLVWDEDTVVLSVSDGAGGNKTISVALDER